MAYTAEDKAELRLKCVDLGTTLRRNVYFGETYMKELREFMFAMPCDIEVSSRHIFSSPSTMELSLLYMKLKRVKPDVFHITKVGRDCDDFTIVKPSIRL